MTEEHAELGAPHMTNAGVEPYGELVARALARASKLGSDEPEEQVTLTGKELVTLATAIETLVRERDEARLIAEKITADSPQAATVSRIILRSGDNAARAVAAEAEVAKLRDELIQTREACSLVRRQDYLDVPTPVLVEAQIEHAVWRALTDAAEATSERRGQVDGVLRRYRALRVEP